MIIAAATFGFDYKFGWEATKGPTFFACIVYFIVNTAFTIWVWGLERGKVYVGEYDLHGKGSGGGGLVSLASSTPGKYDPIYKLRVKKSPSTAKVIRHLNPVIPLVPSTGEIESKDIEARFSRWFDSEGTFIKARFREWLIGNIEMLSEAKKRKEGGGGSAEMDGVEVRVGKDEKTNASLVEDLGEAYIEGEKTPSKKGRKRKA